MAQDNKMCPRYPLHMLQCNGFTDAIVIVQVKISQL